MGAAFKGTSSAGRSSFSRARIKSSRSVTLKKGAGCVDGAGQKLDDKPVPNRSHPLMAAPISDTTRRSGVAIEQVGDPRRCGLQARSSRGARTVRVRADDAAKVPLLRLLDSVAQALQAGGGIISSEDVGGMLEGV